MNKSDHTAKKRRAYMKLYAAPESIGDNNVCELVDKHYIMEGAIKTRQSADVNDTEKTFPLIVDGWCKYEYSFKLSTEWCCKEQDCWYVTCSW